MLGGDSRQFICQLMGATLCVVWAFGATFIAFKIVNSIQPMRVAPEVERAGLDGPAFGLLGYPEGALHATET